MASPEISAVLDFLRRHGFSSAASALHHDISDRGDLPLPPPPVRLGVGSSRPPDPPASADAAALGASSDSDSSSAFLSIGSSPSELLNPFGAWSGASQGKSDDDSSDRLSQFGTAREYGDPMMLNDMYWHNERDGEYRKLPLRKGTKFSSCLSEDKFVMTVGTGGEFGRPTSSGLDLVSQGFHSLTSINSSNNPASHFTNDDTLIDAWQDQPGTKTLDRGESPLCDCCSGQKRFCELQPDDLSLYCQDKEPLGEPDISLYGCCYESMSDETKTFPGTSNLDVFASKILGGCPTTVSLEQNVIDYLHHDTNSIGKSKQDVVSEFPRDQLQMFDLMAAKTSSSNHGSLSKKKGSRDSDYPSERNFDDDKLKRDFNSQTLRHENVPLLHEINDGYGTGGGKTQIRELLENGIASDRGDHSIGSDLHIYDNNEDEFEIFDLRIIHRKNRTGFEENKDFPIVLNTVIAGRYYVTEFLGSAAFSKVIQAHDLQTGMDVCLKIIKNDKDFFDQSLDEIKLLKYVNKFDPADECHILRLYDYFYHQEHLFIVSELLRANLYEFQKYNHDTGGEIYFTLPMIQKIARQCLEALEYLHYLGIIHCDLKPENILIKNYSRCEIKVIDLGSSCFQSDNLCLYVQSRSYRAPEVIIGLPYDQKIDIWSLGCILAELCSGDVLFPNDSLVMLLSRMVGILGTIDMEMLEKGQETHKYFTSDYDLYYMNEDTDQMEYIIPERFSITHLLDVSDTSFIEFVRELLQTNPGRRPTAAEALEHPWLSKKY